MQLRFEESTLQTVLTSSEYKVFRDIVNDIALKDEDIEGVLVTGSLVQRIKLPIPEQIIYDTKELKAYSSIVGRSKRKLWPHLDSDLDIWIMTRDQTPLKVTESLDTIAIELVNLMSRNPNIDLNEWVKLKRDMIGEFYKKARFYSSRWNKNNENFPWEANNFKDELLEDLEAELPEFCKKAKHYFRKRDMNSFIEIRAFPGATFNLRPEKIRLNGKIDRTPFPYYMLDWINIEQNTIVLYASEESIYYPFNLEGHIHSKPLADFLEWKPIHIELSQMRSDNE